MAEITTYKDSYYDGDLHFRLVTCTVANPAVFLRREHGLEVNDRVQFDSDATLPTGLSANTWYFVVTGGLTNDEFEVATTKGGTALQVTVAGTGQLYFASDRPTRMRVSISSSDSCR